MDIRHLLRDCKYADDQLPLDQHFHDDYELIYIRNGMSSIAIGDKTYRLCRGSLVFISRLEDHSITILSGNYERYYVIMRSDKLDTIIDDPRLCSVFRNRPASFSHVVDASAYAEQIDLCFSGIVSEFDAPQEYAPMLLNAYLRQILICAYRAGASDFSFANNSLYDEIYNIQKYIETNYMNDIKIGDIASDNFISLHYLSRCFKQQTGCSPKQYLINTRLAHAKFLLVGSCASISSIAAECGFSDVNNFIRTFREHFGVTPYKFKKGV